MNLIDIRKLQDILRHRLYPAVGVRASIGGGWLTIRKPALPREGATA